MKQLSILNTPVTNWSIECTSCCRLWWRGSTPVTLTVPLGLDDRIDQYVTCNCCIVIVIQEDEVLMTAVYKRTCWRGQGVKSGRRSGEPVVTALFFGLQQRHRNGGKNYQNASSCAEATDGSSWIWREQVICKRLIPVSFLHVQSWIEGLRNASGPASFRESTFIKQYSLCRGSPIFQPAIRKIK